MNDIGSPITKVYDAVIRVSRRNGRGENGDEWSPDRQRADIERYAAARNIQIARWFDESDSVSGKTTEREGLSAACDRAIAGATDGVIVAKLDRFARTVAGGLTVIGKLEAADRDLCAVREGMICGEEARSATSNLMRTIWLALAQWQLETLTEGWTAVRASHIARGIHTVEPYGYRKDDDRRLFIVDAEAHVVSRMFYERAEGAGWVGIAAGLNEDGITSRSGSGWTPQRVKSIVENRVYIGEISSGEFINPDGCPPIVTRELFDRANSRRKTTARRDGKDYPLTGLLYCAECGVKMRGTTTTKGDSEYRQYKCRVNHPFGKCPQPASINADAIEDHVMGIFGRLYFGDAGIILNGHADTSALDAATAELADAEHDLATAAVDPVLDRLRTVSPAAYDAGMTARMVRVENARQAVQTARNEALGVEFPVELESEWDGMPADEQRAYLADAFDLIAIERAPRGTSFADRGIRVFQRGEAPAGIVGRKLTGPVAIAV